MFNDPANPGVSRHTPRDIDPGTRPNRECMQSPRHDRWRGDFRAWLRAGLLMLLVCAAAPAWASKAIQFEFNDIDGKPVRLEDFRGKWVLVNFWAPWCPLCWAEVPTLNKMHKRGDFVVIGVGLDYGPDANMVRTTAKKHGLEFIIVAGGSRRDASSPYRQVGPVDFFPTSYLYDPTGDIVMFVPGQVRESKLRVFIDDWTRKHAKKGGGR